MKRCHPGKLRIKLAFLMSKALLRAALLMLLFGLAHCGRSPETEAHRRISALLNEGHYKEARLLLSQELTRTPGDKKLLEDQLVMLLASQDRSTRSTFLPAYQQLVQAGGGQDFIEEAAKNRLIQVRQNTAFLLGVLREPQGRKILAALAQDRSTEVRVEAVHSLARLQDTANRGLFLILLKDGAWQVRAEVAAALECLGDVTTSPYLLRASNDPDDFARSAILEAVIHLAHPSQTALYVTNLRDGDRRRQIAAALALGKIRRSEATALLLELVQDKKSPQRAAAAESLARISPQAAAPVFEKLLPTEQDGRVKSTMLDCLQAGIDGPLESAPTSPADD